MIQQVIILLVGFIFLVKGADWFVEVRLYPYEPYFPKLPHF